MCANLETQQIKKIEKKIYIMSNDQDSLAAAGMFETEVCFTNYVPGVLSVSNYILERLSKYIIVICLKLVYIGGNY